MLKEWESLPLMILSSALSGLGREQILDVMIPALEAFDPGSE
jgi:hypothetical protein